VQVTGSHAGEPELFALKDIAQRAKRSVRSIHSDRGREDCPLYGNLALVGSRLVCDRPTLVRYLDWLMDLGRAAAVAKAPALSERARKGHRSAQSNRAAS
jgi:hypothetical protein